MNELLEPNIDLEALFAADSPPAHDADFVVGVMKRSARRKMIWELAGAALIAALSALVLWATGPILIPVLKPVSMMLLFFMPAAATIGAVIILVHPRAVA